MGSLATLERTADHSDKHSGSSDRLGELATELQADVLRLSEAAGLDQEEAAALSEFLIQGNLELASRFPCLKRAIIKLQPAVDAQLCAPLEEGVGEAQITRSLLKSAVYATRLSLPVDSGYPLSFLSSVSQIRADFGGDIPLNVIYEAQAEAIKELADVVANMSSSLRVIAEDTIPEEVLRQIEKASSGRGVGSRKKDPLSDEERLSNNGLDFDLLPQPVKEVALYILTGGDNPPVANREITKKALTFLAGKKLDPESAERFQALNIGTPLLPAEISRSAALGFETIVDLPWAEGAKCLQADPDTFFPEKGGSTRESKRICAGCKVKVECLEYALANDERFGIWGGFSERERRRMKRLAS